MDENRRAEPEGSGAGTGKRSVQLTKLPTVKTFIGNGEKRDRFRSDETSRRCLASIVHDEVFMFGVDNREVKVKGSRCGEDRG